MARRLVCVLCLCLGIVVAAQNGTRTVCCDSVSIQGNCITIAGNETCNLTSSRHLVLNGKHICLQGNQISVHGNHITLHGNHITIYGSVKDVVTTTAVPEKETMPPLVTGNQTMLLGNRTRFYLSLIDTHRTVIRALHTRLNFLGNQSAYFDVQIRWFNTSGGKHVDKAEFYKSQLPMIGSQIKIYKKRLEDLEREVKRCQKEIEVHQNETRVMGDARLREMEKVWPPGVPYRGKKILEPGSKYYWEDDNYGKERKRK